MATRVIVNPSAGAGRAKERLLSIRGLIEAKWQDVEWVESTSGEHLTHLAAEAAGLGYERVVMAGGDGTVHLGANGLVNTKTSLGILPVGTGNDIAASVGLPKDFDAAAEMMLGGHIHKMDVGQIGDRVFCCVLGVGMDTAALKLINKSWMRRGKLIYVISAIRTILTYKPRFLTVRSDDHSFNGKAFFVAATITPTYAGGIPVAPTADVEDGLMDLCIVSGMGVVKVLSIFNKMMKGKHVGQPGIELRKTTHLVIEGDEPLPITLDGELTDLVTPAEIRVLPGALSILGAPY